MNILRGLAKLLALSQKSTNTDKKQLPKAVANIAKRKARSGSSISKRDVMAKLPKEMRPFTDNVLASKLARNKVALEKQEQTTATQSKVGGFPYFPDNLDLPLDANGKHLDFLAQINFAEMPQLDGYPTSGVVQFFIERSHSYGLDLGDRKPQKNYRVIYHENTENVSRAAFPELEAIRQYGDHMSPLQSPNQYAMKFKQGVDFIPPSSIYMDQYFEYETFGFWERFGEKEREITRAYGKFAVNTGHKIGGYPYFTQDDPRMYDDSIKNWIVLFQLDSEGDIMWGDAGVGNFFIAPEDLKKGDFSSVFYNWDCR
ncbi:MAG: DUF1963 domain-containing protein [Crocinitomix sp.]|nr:DUF1963 domain-containing protein [Crocinitomix sp.]